MTGHAVEPNEQRLSWRVRLLLGGYPPWWRLRYDDEMRDTVLAMQAAGQWRPKDGRDLFRGLIEAWFNPALVGDGLMTDPTRRLIPRTAWGLVLFVLAGGGFAKVIDDPAVTAATHRHPAIQWSLWGLMAAAAATALVMAACTIPYVWAILRQGRRPALRTLAPLVVVPVCAAVVAAVVAVSFILADSTPVHSARHVVAFLAIVAATILSGVCCTVAVLRVATRAPERPEVRLSRRVGLVAVGAGTTVAVLAVMSWVVAVAVESPHLLHSDNGMLATPTMPSLALAFAGLVGAAALCAPSGMLALSSREGAPRSSS